MNASRSRREILWITIVERVQSRDDRSCDNL